MSNVCLVRMEDAVKVLLECVGEDVTRGGLQVLLND